MIAMKRQAPTAFPRSVCMVAYRILPGEGEGAQEEAVEKEPVIYYMTHAYSATVMN